jgi:CheY-like chemotaxis protein
MSLAGTLVFIVDTDKDHLFKMKDTFENKGAQVVVANSVDEAYEVIRNIDPDMMISDIHLGGDFLGEELMNDCLFLKQNKPLCFYLSELKIKEKLSGIILTKPFDFEAFLIEVKNLQKNIGYFKNVLNIEAYRYKELETSLVINGIELDVNFIEMTSDAIIAEILTDVAMEMDNIDCSITIKNFLNDSSAEYKLRGKIKRTSLSQSDRRNIEIKLKDASLIHWKRMQSLVEDKQNEIMDFLKKVSG